MFSEGTYTLSKIRLDRTKLEWIDPSFQVTLQVGRLFGKLCIERFCVCCNIKATFTYFFVRMCSNHTLRCMQPYFHNESAQLFLPTGEIGLFLPIVADKNCDSQILSHAIHDRTGYVFMLKHFYRSIRDYISMRTAFRRLYFDWCKASFHPEGPQGKRMIDSWMSLVESEFSSSKKRCL